MNNTNLLAFVCLDPQNNRNKVQVIRNFNVSPQAQPLDSLKRHGFFQQHNMKDLCTGTPVTDDTIIIPALSFYWLAD